MSGPIEHRVVGPPGCGKTTYLQRQCVLAAQKYRPEAISIVSLTRSAAAEIGGRDTGIPPANVGTLHAHAYRALDRPALAESAEGIQSWNETCGAASWRLTTKNLSPEHAGAAVELVSFDDEGDRMLQAISVLRNQEVDPAGWPPDLQHFHTRWETWKTGHSRVDFTDLIQRAATEIRVMPTMPTILMADEAQDMSRLEMRLLRQWSIHATQLVVVGDPDQALYTWRGADPRAVFGDDPENVRVLSRSYRVPAAVHEVAVSMIRRCQDRLDVEYHPRQDDDGNDVAGDCITAALQYVDPGPVIETIETELADGRSVMVLGSCNYMLNPLVAALREKGIPFANPYRRDRGQWNPLAGVGRLIAFLRAHGEALPQEMRRMWTWDDMRRWTDPMIAKGILTHGSKAFIAAKCLADGKTDRFGEELPSSAHDQLELSMLMGLFHSEHVDHLVDVDVNWWESHLRHKEAKSQAFALQCYRRNGAAGLIDDPRVIVGTVHSVKGGEADTVILFPDLSNQGYWNGLKVDGEPHDSVIRQFYVGMTRAREKLILGQASGHEAITW